MPYAPVFVQSLILKLPFEKLRYAGGLWWRNWSRCNTLLSVTICLTLACLLLMKIDQQLDIKLCVYTTQTESGISRTKRLSLDVQGSKWVNISFHDLFCVNPLSSFLSSWSRFASIRVRIHLNDGSDFFSLWRENESFHISLLARISVTNTRQLKTRMSGANFF